MIRRSFIGGAAAVLLLMLVFPAAARTDSDDLEGKVVRKRPFTFFLPVKWQTPFLYAVNKPRIRGVRELNYTKDGFALDIIQFRSRSIKIPFDFTKKKLTPEMAPFEMAQLVISDLELNKLMQGLKIHENKPVTVCGRPGFRIVYSYRDNGTLAYKSVYYGFQRKNVFYTIRYEAPVIHYFDTYLPTFEKVVQSASLILREDKNADDKQDFNPDPEPTDNDTEPEK